MITGRANDRILLPAEATTAFEAEAGWKVVLAALSYHAHSDGEESSGVVVRIPFYHSALYLLLPACHAVFGQPCFLKRVIP